MQKTGRNDPCVCGSGKKFKKCCERKMIGKRFMATKIDNQNLSTISSFFKKNVTQVQTTNLDESKKINAQLKTTNSSDKISINNLHTQEIAQGVN
jgi:hypothetical protein